MGAGYSKTPLDKKLGIKADDIVVVLNSPGAYEAFFSGDTDFEVSESLASSNHFIHYFATERERLSADINGLKSALEKDGILWISWPKKTSAITSDLDGNIVRAIGLDAGLVDVKVAAIDEDWSGLKFVWRLSDR